MKKYLKRIILLFLTVFLVSSFSGFHKFYLSVTEVNYSEKDSSLQLLSRIFIDDLESVLQERYEVDLALATPEEAKDANDYIEKYLKGRIIIKINDIDTPFTFLGKQYDNDVMKTYLEVENVNFDTIKTIEIENTLMFELFEEQQNIVHFKFEKNKKSFILIRENDKGLLKL